MRRGLLLAGILLLSGCSSSSFVGRRLGNFTAYYNTFYNARDNYDQAVRALRKSDEVVDRTRYLSVFPTPPPGANVQQLQNAITKSADVLRKHPDSKWADDALLLIGKSYYYLGQYVGAEQKFREVIVEWPVQTGKPSSLEEEARLWLARALVASEQYGPALEHLTASLARERVPRRWAGQLYLAQADLQVKQGDWDAAATSLREGIERVRNRTLRARAYFLLGQVEETRGRYGEAIKAFEKVDDLGPEYSLRYAAQLSAARIEGLHIDADAALQKLRRMERDGKNYALRNEIRYVRGRIYQAQGRGQAALDTYDGILYGGDGDPSAVRGQVHYALGELFRDIYQDYFLASAHFDTASSTLNTSGLTGRTGGVTPSALARASTREAILDATQQREVFGSFARVMSEIELADSLLALGSLDAESFAERVRALRRQRAREMEAEQRMIQRQMEERAFSGNVSAGGGFGDDPSRTTGGAGVPQAGPVGTTAAQSTAGFLFHKDPVRIRENRQAFVERWGERPLVPNWRRREAVQGTDAVALEASLTPAQGTLNRVGDGAEEVLPEVDLSGIPRTPEAIAAMRTRRANARYSLANVLFLSMNQPDSAATWYRRVIEEDPDEEVAPRAFYALAEVQRELGDTLSANRLYREALAAYPGTDFSARIREQLGLGAETVALADSLAMARAAYEEASVRRRQGRLESAVASYVQVAADYRETPVAPQALFAAATLFLELAARDSLDPLVAPLPVSYAVLVRAGAGSPDPGTRPEVAAFDSLGMPASSGAVNVGSDTSGIGVYDLYRAIVTRHPQTPYAERAQAILAALDERRAPAPESTPVAAAQGEMREETIPQDSPAQTPPPAQSGETEVDDLPFRRETLPSPQRQAPPIPEDQPRVEPEPEAVRPDTSSITPPVPSPEPPVAREPAPTPPDAEDALLGTQPVTAGQGWTLIVGGAPTEAAAEAIAARYREQGYRVGILPGRTSGGDAIFRVGVGQFNTDREATRALNAMKGQALPADSWLFRLR